MTTGAPGGGDDITSLSQAVDAVRAADEDVLRVGATLIRVSSFCARAIATAGSFGLDETSPTQQMLRGNQALTLAAADAALALGAALESLASRLQSQE